LVDVDLFYDLPNQIVERPTFAFIADVEYEKLPLFCSNCKMIGRDLSNYGRLEQDGNVIIGAEKTVGVKIQYHYHPKVMVHMMGLRLSSSA